MRSCLNGCCWVVTVGLRSVWEWEVVRMAVVGLLLLGCYGSVWEWAIVWMAVVGLLLLGCYGSIWDRRIILEILLGCYCWVVMGVYESEQLFWIAVVGLLLLGCYGNVWEWAIIWMAVVGLLLLWVFGSEYLFGNCSGSIFLTDKGGGDYTSNKVSSTKVDEIEPVYHQNILWRLFYWKTKQE